LQGIKGEDKEGMGKKTFTDAWFVGESNRRHGAGVEIEMRKRRGGGPWFFQKTGGLHYGHRVPATTTNPDKNLKMGCWRREAMRTLHKKRGKGAG